MFLPTTADELKKRNWQSLDIILISGDTYIDVPSDGTALLSRYLERNGYRVGIIAQPDITLPKDIMRLGEPNLFWGVTGGAMDSMVANYTASGKRRKSDDLTPGGINNRRPDRAVIRYVNLIKQYSRKKAPIVIGGIEASLRRIAHYDYWSNSVRKSILLDSKADILVYGMAERSILQLAQSMSDKKDYAHISGICYMSREKPFSGIELPPYNDVESSHESFIHSVNQLYQNVDPVTGETLYQQYDKRYLVCNPPQPYGETDELDSYFESSFMRDLHPYYAREGKVKALDTVRFSVTSHRGCYGDCSFCSITLHQGTRVLSRSEESIMREVESFQSHPMFRGTVSDVGGPTANMYGSECRKMVHHGRCNDRGCIGTDFCHSMKISHKRYMNLLQKLRELPGIKHIFVASGLRYDLILRDKQYGEKFLEELILHHISGQLRIAPEHVSDNVLTLMNKPPTGELEEFTSLFQSIVKKHNLKKFLTYYFIAAHPGCDNSHMKELSIYTRKTLKIEPQSVQIFTPTPLIRSTMLYHTSRDREGRNIFVEKDKRKKEEQKNLVIAKDSRRK